VLYRVPATGGQPAKLTELDASKQETAHFHPVFLPDNKHFLFTAWSRNPLNRAIYVGSIDSSDRVRLIDAASMAAYSPPGFLLFQRDGTLMAEPFDATRRVTRGEAFPIAEDLSYLPDTGRSSFSVSRNGTLAHTTQNALSANGQLAWYDRTGKVLGMAGHPDAYLQVRLSPDEKRVAYDRGIGSIFQNDRHLWLLDLTSGIASPFTFGSDGEGQPVWSPDGRQVAFVKVKEGKGTIYLKNVGANEEELLSGSDGFQNLEDWSRDGQTLIVRTTAPNPDAVFALPLTGERKATKLFESPFRKQKVQLSPDGRWVSFNSNDSGKMEVYVASFPAFTDRRQVSNAGGAQARWRKDGRELFYLGLDGKLMSVDIKTMPALESGIPKILFQTRIPVRLFADQYSPTADGQKFLLLEPLESASARPTPITVVLDWTAALPTGK